MFCVVTIPGYLLGFLSMISLSFGSQGILLHFLTFLVSCHKGLLKSFLYISIYQPGFHVIKQLNIVEHVNVKGYYVYLFKCPFVINTSYVLSK